MVHSTNGLFSCFYCIGCVCGCLGQGKVIQGWRLNICKHNFLSPACKASALPWFTYSAAEESMAELGRSQHEYGSCNAANPIWMYTGGLYKIELDHRGRRNFVSSAPGSCSKGCKSPSLQSQWPSNHPGKFRQQQQGQCHPVL